MKMRTCNRCGDTVYLPERDEPLNGHETPYEHYELSGHVFNQPVIRRCLDCDYVWGYSGNSDRPTCANCRGKRTVPIDE